MLDTRSTSLLEALKRCESEPIQYIGSIQDHGALLAIDGQSIVRAVSANLQDLLGIAAASALNQPCEQVLGTAACTTFGAMSVKAGQLRPVPAVLKLKRDGAELDHQAQLHRIDEMLIVEIERREHSPQAARSLDFDSINGLLNALAADVDGIDGFAAVIADEVRQLTGFDRVMVYQFDDQWNGNVLAENKRQGMNSFLGHHFPASDIPPPARALFTRNLVRMLVDRDAVPVHLLQSTTANMVCSIDLSLSVLRSMAPIHLEYLRNLGVRASLTASLLQNGRLWGLIACHHESPRRLSFKLRQAMELVAVTVATRLDAIAYRESSRYHAKVRDILPRLVHLVRDTPGGAILAPELEQEVLGLVNASGALIATGDSMACIGLAPSAAQVEPLLAWLRSRRSADRILAIQALSDVYPPAAEFSDIASGLLAIRLDADGEQFLLWFREEVIRSIPWAGNAAKHLVEDEQGPKLEPRHSFDVWVQTRRGESPPWSAAEVDTARTLSITLAELFARQQLASAEASMRLAASVYENSSEGMLVTDGDNVIIAVNPAFTVQTGYSASEAIGATPALLKSGRHDQAFYQAMWRALNAGGNWCGEIWNRRKNGEIYPEWLTINTVRDMGGRVHRRVALFTDILQRKQAEAALRASETRFRSVFEKAYTGMALGDRAGTLLEVNEALAQMLGYSRRELIGMNIAQFTQADDFKVEAVFLKELQARQRDEYRMDKRYVTKSGDVIWVDLLVTVVRDDHGDVVNVVGLVVDITERKRAEQDLRIAATAFESQEGMTITDAKGVILRVNRAFSEITGYAAEEVVGKNPHLLNSGRHDVSFFAAMWQSIARTGSWQGEIWNRRKNGEIYPEWLSIAAVKGERSIVTHYVGTFSDITPRKAAESEIAHLAFYDHLTGLPNRRLMQDRLQHALASAARHGSCGALMLIDLDNFKMLNDTLGHAVGDQLLSEVALRLKSFMRRGDTVARLGGDEFVVILEDFDEPELVALNAENVAAKILARLSEPYVLRVTNHEAAPNTHSHHCTSSIGITLFRDTSISVDELMKRADTAMYQAKAAGRNALRFFDLQMQATVKARAALELDLRQAIVEGQFLLHYQAQVDASGRVAGAEVLVRWQHPRRGLVSPAEFIPLAEDTGLILPLGHRVLEIACTQLAAWATQPDKAHLSLAVNVSARQFGLPSFVEQVLALLDHTGARPNRLKLELTESLLVNDTENVIAKMKALKAHGVGFSLDDFGTGYSSLSYLKRLPLDQLKIDQSFVRDILIDPNDVAIARTVVALGKSLGLAVIAEGVETATQRDILASLGCLAYQGYFFSRPLPLDGFEAFLGHDETSRRPGADGVVESFSRRK